MQSQGTVSNDLQYNVKQNLIRILKKISNDILVISIYS